jgi:hypothetical protein
MASAGFERRHHLDDHVGGCGRIVRRERPALAHQHIGRQVRGDADHLVDVDLDAEHDHRVGDDRDGGGRAARVAVALGGRRGVDEARGHEGRDRLGDGGLRQAGLAGDVDAADGAARQDGGEHPRPGFGRRADERRARGGVVVHRFPRSLSLR